MTATAQDTLRLEAPLRYLARHPGASLAQVALVFRHLGLDLKADLLAWLKKHNHGAADLTEPTLDAVKQSSGTLVIRQAPPARALPPLFPMKNKDKATTANTGAPAPWLKLTRKIRTKVLAKYRPRLEAMARGDPEPGNDDGPWLAFLRKNLGTARVGAETTQAFLRWLDAGGVNGPERAVATKDVSTPDKDIPRGIAATDRLTRPDTDVIPAAGPAPVQLVRIVVEVRIVTRVEQG